MTAPAAITQADMERATKAVARAKFPSARIIMRLATAEIEIIVGESVASTLDQPFTDDWNDDDV